MFDIKKFKLNLKPLGNNVFNNILSTNQNLLGNTNNKLVNNKEVHKKILYYGNKGNAPPVSYVKKIYSKIPDDETVPVVFQTKRQYLQEYIKNQERKNGVVFTKQEKERYLNNELKEMRPIVSRFTTYHNPYMPPRVVYFTDNKVSKQQFQHNAHHEFGHELYERQARVRQNWNMRVTPQTSPTNYGKTSVDEDFAESYALYKENKLRDGNRANVFNNIQIDQASKNYEDEGPDEYIWGHKWVEDEYGQPKRISFKVPTRNLGSTRKSVKMKDVEDIVAAPFLTKEEKTQKLEEIGATRGIVRMAEMKLSQNRRRRIGGSQWK